MMTFSRSLPVLKLDFSLGLPKGAILPRFKGSMLRGLLGRSLKYNVCSFKQFRYDCRVCPILGDCVYSKLFETPKILQAEDRYEHLMTFPHPYRIAATTEQEVFAVDETLIFSFYLFGAQVSFAPFVVAAYDTGRHLTGRRIPYKLNLVLTAGQPYYAHGEFVAPVHPISLALPEIPIDQGMITALISMISPLRLKDRQGFIPPERFDEQIFKRCLLRRLAMLFSFYAIPQFGMEDFFTAYENISPGRMVESDLNWEENPRYSMRQEERMSMGGLRGHFVLTGLSQVYLELLRLGAVVGLGKNTAFGLGEIAVKEIPGRQN